MYTTHVGNYSLLFSTLFLHSTVYLYKCFTFVNASIYSTFAFNGAGYAETNVLPTLKRVGKKEGKP